MGMCTLLNWKHKSWILFSLLICHKFIHNSLCISCTNTMEESSQKTAGFSASQEICHSFWNPKVYHCGHTAHHWALFWNRWMQSTHSHPISLRSIIGLSCHLHLDLLSGLFASGFCAKNLYAVSCAPPPPPQYLLFLIYCIKTEPNSVYMEPSYIDLWHVLYPKFVIISGFL
jgi:hypothetical protein